MPSTPKEVRSVLSAALQQFVDKEFTPASESAIRSTIKDTLDRVLPAGVTHSIGKITPTSVDLSINAPSSVDFVMTEINLGVEDVNPDHDPAFMVRLRRI